MAIDRFNNAPINLTAVELINTIIKHVPQVLPEIIAQTALDKTRFK